MRYHSWATVSWKGLTKTSKKLEMQLVFLEDSQSYFHKIFVNLNLSVAMTVSSYFSTLSSRLWDNSINVVIILDNDHRFKEDPEYGIMLKRMWNGDLTSEDRKQINTRVIGYQGLKLPTTFEGRNFTFIKCIRYLNCIYFTTAWTFKRFLK